MALSIRYFSDQTYGEHTIRTVFIDTINIYSVSKLNKHLKKDVDLSVNFNPDEWESTFST